MRTRRCARVSFAAVCVDKDEHGSRKYRKKQLEIMWATLNVYSSSQVARVPECSAVAIVGAHLLEFSCPAAGEFAAHTSNVNCLALSPTNGRTLVTGGDDRRVNLWIVGQPNCLMVSSVANATQVATSCVWTKVCKSSYVQCKLETCSCVHSTSTVNVL